MKLCIIEIINNETESTFKEDKKVQKCVGAVHVCRPPS